MANMAPQDCVVFAKYEVMQNLRYYFDRDTLEVTIPMLQGRIDPTGAGIEVEKVSINSGGGVITESKSFTVWCI